ncbi:PIN-like domain-containing protein [Oerskovia jenensis]|uniref:PIN like domain-containing protein n=1 Tax=Oerskovia jenensis TaxID=162169 RepID=A0ABS2LEA7_9CELL|nr:PIN-like domain-containing protein [Oerskovia jenensis]MBM7478741.1 hypothetical protein [Oerskovia jenensis]
MRTALDQYRVRTQDEIYEALGTATIVLDTNVLTGLYGVSPELREARLGVLKQISDRLWVPYQVGLEFHRNRARVIRDLSDAYKSVRDTLTPVKKAAKTFGKSKFSESQARVQKAVDEAVAKLEGELRKLEADDGHHLKPADDKLLDRIETLLDGRVGTAPSAKLTRKRVRKFVTIRAPERIPPGFSDISKIATSGPTDAAGDFLVWCEMLQYARTSKSNVVFVTDDGKEDWWEKGGDGVPTRPLPALLAEFARKTGQNYYQVSTESLMRWARDSLNAEVSTANLTEESAISRERRSESALEEALRARIWGQTQTDWDHIRSALTARTVHNFDAMKFPTIAYDLDALKFPAIEFSPDLYQNLFSGFNLYGKVIEANPKEEGEDQDEPGDGNR